MDPRIHFSAESLTKIKDRMGASAPDDPTPSATVVLLRDSTSHEAPVIYLQKRQSSMVFGGRPVFPGGKLDPADLEEFGNWGGASPEEWGGRLGTTADMARGLIIAAVRETFEESGYLLATRRDGGNVTELDTEEWRADRDALADRDIAFAELLAKHDLTLRTDWLKPWSVWVTPEIEPRRFHTWFFVARCPAHQRVLGVSRESTIDGWITPAEAVRQADAGELQLMPPQLCTFLELYGHSSTAEVMGSKRGLLEVRPHLVEHGDGTGHLELPEPLITRAAEAGAEILTG